VFAGSPADFGRHVAEETQKWAKVVKFAGIKPEWLGAAGTFHKFRTANRTELDDRNGAIASPPHVIRRSIVRKRDFAAPVRWFGSENLLSCSLVGCRPFRIASTMSGAVAGLVGIECGVVSGVFNLESSGVRAPDWRPRHDEKYHDA
jgi:hypothetical protein